MIPVRTADCNFTYTAPQGKPGVGDLPCQRHDGITTSWWQPEPAERLAIAAGGLIQFQCHSSGHPVIAIGATEPTPSTPDDPVVTPAMAALVHRTIVAWHLALCLESKELPDLGILDGFSLAQLCTAVLMHEALRPKTPNKIQPTIDDRLVAACYTFIHYRLRPQDDDHEVIVHDGKQALYIAWGNGCHPGA